MIRLQDRFSRIDNSLWGRWWWTIDRWMLLCIVLLMSIGVLLVLAASPAVAERLKLNTFFFFRQHMMYLPLALAVMLGVSVLSPKNIRRLACCLFLVFLTAMVFTFFWGSEVKGAQRWLYFLGMNLQPSEFMKPCLIVVTGWMLSEYAKNPEFPGLKIALGLVGLVVTLVLLQPDLGMAIVILTMWFGQWFIAGLSFFWIASIVTISSLGMVGLYYLFPHVQHRIDSFLHDDMGDKYQISLSLESFANAGFWGQGPGEGVIKNRLPDAHSDFIFAVAAEEFGLLLCWVILALYATIVIRGLVRAYQTHQPFVMLTVSGLLIGFGFQAMVNMASSLHLIPTKGMTLPFISYGGSSLLAIALTMGMVLGLCRKS